jgi:prophage regulatory protein
VRGEPKSGVAAMSLLSFSDLQSRGIRLSADTLARLERSGEFPRRVRISHHRHGWVAAEIESWLSARAAEREVAS